jgi:D-proline reductase (dithiol) PrdA
MSITAETAKEHANDPAVLCCRAEEGITIEPANLEDPAIFDELVDSGLLKLDGCLTIKEILGAKLTKTCDSLTPITLDVIDAPVASAEEAPAEEAVAEEVAEVPTVSGSVQGVGATIKGGKVIISIKEGKDIYLELPI